MTSRLQVIIFISEPYIARVSVTRAMSLVITGTQVLIVAFLERLYNAASDRAAVAEKVRDEAHDLDKEEALSRTDTLLSLLTLPLNDK